MIIDGVPVAHLPDEFSLAARCEKAGSRAHDEPSVSVGLKAVVRIARAQMSDELIAERDRPIEDDGEHRRLRVDGS